MKEKKSFFKGALFGALAMLLIAGLVSCGLKLGDSSREAVTSETEEKIAELKKLIDKNYLHDVDEEELQEGIYKGYISGLDDPYSVYYDEEETKSFYETTEGEYDGIGAVLSQNMDTGIITLVQIYEDSPAMKAGLQDEDILYKVDKEEVTGEDLTEVVSHIKGEKGTTVDITVLRGEENEEVTVTVTRDTIQAQTVEYRML